MCRKQMRRAATRLVVRPSREAWFRIAPHYISKQPTIRNRRGTRQVLAVLRRGEVGLRPPCMHSMTSPSRAAYGMRLKTQRKSIHILLLYRGVPVLVPVRASPGPVLCEAWVNSLFPSGGHIRHFDHDPLHAPSPTSQTLHRPRWQPSSPRPGALLLRSLGLRAAAPHGLLCCAPGEGGAKAGQGPRRTVLVPRPGRVGPDARAGPSRRMGRRRPSRRARRSGGRAV